MRRVLAAAISAALLGASLTAQNLLANPSFESGTLAGWSTFGNAFSEATNPPEIVPRTGAKVCKIFGNFTTPPFNVSGVYQTFPAVGGEHFQLDCYTRHWSGDALFGPGQPNFNWAVMKIAFFDPGNTEIGSVETTVLDGTSPTDAWIDNGSIAGVAPAGTVSVQALLLFLQPQYDGGAAQFDDVEFVRLAPATCSTTGTGCGAVGDPAHIYEQFSTTNPFDLQVNGWQLTGNNSVGTTLLPLPAILPPSSPDLGLGDDENTPPIPLGFNFAPLGLPCADSISVSSNGYIWLGTTGPADFSESAAEFHSQGARICVLWDDLQPAAGGGAGTIHVDIASNVVVVTWLGVNYFGGGPAVTAQCVIVHTLTGGAAINSYCVYAGAFNDAGIVGFANGFAQPVTPTVDLNGAAVGPIPSGGIAGLALDCVNAPLLGGALDVALRNVPNGGIGAVLARIGVTGAPIPLIGPFPTGCSAYVPPSSPSLGIVVNANQCTAYPFSISVPPGPFWIGLPFALQGAALDVNNNQFIAANAIDARVGNF